MVLREHQVPIPHNLDAMNDKINREAVVGTVIQRVKRVFGQS